MEILTRPSNFCGKRDRRYPPHVPIVRPVKVLSMNCSEEVYRSMLTAHSVAVSWFSAPEEVPAVRLAFSEDGGRSFLDPVIIDDCANVDTSFPGFVALAAGAGLTIEAAR